MKKYLFLAVLVIAALWIGCENMEGSHTHDEEGEAAADTLSQEELIKRGEYIVSTSGCNDCHTPKKMTETGPQLDTDRLLSGHPADQQLPPIDTSMVGPWILFSPNLTACVGPWGISYSANITSHESGIGNWTEENFFRSIREGKHKGLEDGRAILPPMPWQEIALLTDEDLRAVYHFLKSTKPVDNVVPAPVPPNKM